MSKDIEDVEVREEQVDSAEKTVRDNARDERDESRDTAVPRVVPKDQKVAAEPMATDEAVAPTDERIVETDEPVVEKADAVVAKEPVVAKDEPLGATAEPIATPRDGREAETRASLFEHDRASDLRTRWSDVQTRFVDDPREAVKAADSLVEEVIRDLSSLFAAERSALETQWGRDQEVSTEDLRVALRRYRSFFERLLSI